jgi:hypothetical protein
MRSLARALSSSRRAPPKAASKPLSLMASSSVTVWRRLRDPMGPGSATLPWSMESCTLATSSFTPSEADLLIAVAKHLGEVLARVDVKDREGELLGGEGLQREVQQHRRVLAARKEQDRPLALGHDLAQDEDGVGLEQVEVVGSSGGA